MAANVRRWRRRLAWASLVLGLWAGSSAKAADETSDAHLLVATVDNYLPCSDEAENNYEGLSIDVWRRVAESINRPYTLATIATFSQAVDAAAYGTVDLVVSCHKITPERLQRVEFSVPYTRDSLGMLSRRSQGLNFSVAQRLLGDSIVRVSLLTLLLISGLSAFALSSLEDNFKGMSGFSGRRRVRFSKAWIMLLIGSGVDKLLHLNQRAHALILLASGIRILFLSVLVGTTATLIFETRKPLDASKLSASQLKTVLIEGVAVNAGTKMHDWLLLQIDRHNLNQVDHGAVLAVERQGALEDALRSGAVRHIVSDVSVLTQVMQNLADPDGYRLSLEMPNKTPQAFIFGASLSPELKQSINIALAKMNYGGDSARLERSWQKSMR